MTDRYPQSSLASSAGLNKKAPAVEATGHTHNWVELARRRVCGCRSHLPPQQFMAVCSPLLLLQLLLSAQHPFFLAFFHRGFHVFSVAARLAIFHFILVLTATGRGVFGVGRGVMATPFVVFHFGHVVMTAPSAFGAGEEFGAAGVS